MSKSITANIGSISKNRPHALLLVDNIVIEILLEGLRDLDPARTIATPKYHRQLIDDLNRARKAFH
jgi:hypothetical protein